MIDVLIVDDRITVKEILKSYIEPDPGLNLIGCASNGEEAIELVKIYQPHIVLMDIEMPVMDGLTATRIITEKFIKTSVLIISVHNDDSYLNSALQVGASRNVESGSKTSLENRCDALEKQIYHISHHLNRLEKKINLLKPLVTLAILCCAFLALALLLSFLV